MSSKVIKNDYIFELGLPLFGADLELKKIKETINIELAKLNTEV